MTTRRAGAERGGGPAEHRADGELTFLRGGGEVVRDLDTVFDILSSRRRRIVLDHLRECQDEWVTVDALAEEVAAWEVELAGPTSVSEESIAIDIAHGHLPRLDASGVVVYDDDERRVTYRGDDRVERFLDLAKREGPLP